MDKYFLYWVFEYIKVFISYGFIMFIYPAIVFRKYLKGKSVTFGFAFCSTMQVLLLSTIVLFLGLFHILNRFTMWVVIWGIFIWSIKDFLELTPNKKNEIKKLVTGTYGRKTFFVKKFSLLKDKVNKGWVQFHKFYKKHYVEYTLLVIVVIYGMIYFSWGIFHEFSYGFGDMYVHHSWIKGLMQGQIFSDGVYPEAMHCVIYSLYALFGIDVYSITMYLPVIHLAITFLAEYCFFKEMFHWRFSGIFTLILFLTLDVVCINEVFSMSRLQWALPQEYGFFCMYLCALFLIKYLKANKHFVFKEFKTKGYWDENLLIFTLALAASIAIHFYSTIMAFLICVGIALFYLKEIFNKKRFVPLVVAAVCGVMIAIVPMIGALASGIPFQKSIDWAMNIMNGIDPEQGYTAIAGDEYEQEYEQEIEFEEEYIETPTYDDTQQITGTETNNSDNITSNTEPIKLSLVDKVKNVCIKIKNKILFKWKIIYEKSYVTLYRTDRANWILGFTCLPIILGFVYKVIVLIIKYILRKKHVQGGFFQNYLPLVVGSFLFMLFYCAAYVGLPGLVAGARLCTTGQLLILSVIIIPFDIIFYLLDKNCSLQMMNILSAGTAVGLVVFVCLTGNFHGYLYYELSRYSASVKVTKSIMDELPKNTYTIVSTTDEIYQVIENGRHEELLTFMEANEAKKEYTIPTEYIFFYVEKKPLLYAHNHFFSGPDWVALETYDDIYSAFTPSVWPEATAGTISTEKAQMNIIHYGKPSDSYSELYSREILQSKMYQWCQEFSKMYPNEFKVYYEDENLICYYLKQNPQHLYNLVLK